MKYIKLFLLAVLFLASCTPSMQSPTPAQMPTQTFTPIPTATATQTPSPTPTIIPTPTPIGGGVGKLIFDLQKTDFAGRFPDLQGDLNIFIANMDGTDLVPVTADGLRGFNYLQSISPDGTKVLIASASDIEFQTDRHSILYSIDLNSLNSKPIQISKGITEYAVTHPDIGRESIAKWIDNTRLVYIGGGDKGYGIYTVNWDGSNPLNIYSNNTGGPGRKPAGILGVDNTRVYWYSNVAYKIAYNMESDKDYAWWSSLDGSEQGALEYKGNQINS